MGCSPKGLHPFFIPLYPLMKTTHLTHLNNGRQSPLHIHTYNAIYGLLWGLWWVCVGSGGDYPSPIHPLPPVGWGFSQKPGAQLLAKNFTYRKEPFSKGPSQKIFTPDFSDFFPEGVPLVFKKGFPKNFLPKNFQIFLQANRFWSISVMVFRSKMVEAFYTLHFQNLCSEFH